MSQCEYTNTQNLYIHQNQKVYQFNNNNNRKKETFSIHKRIILILKIKSNKIFIIRIFSCCDFEIFYKNKIEKKEEDEEEEDEEKSTTETVSGMNGVEPQVKSAKCGKREKLY